MAMYTLYPDEWYPVYQLNRYCDGNPNNDLEAEFSDEEIIELRALEERVNAWQRKIAERFGVLPCFKQRVLVYEEDCGGLTAK